MQSNVDTNHFTPAGGLPAKEDTMTTPTIYTYKHEHGHIVDLLPTWETASINEKEIAAVRAAQGGRRANLRRALNAMFQAGEKEIAADIARVYLDFSRTA